MTTPAHHKTCITSACMLFDGSFQELVQQGRAYGIMPQSSIHHCSATGLQFRFLLHQSKTEMQCMQCSGSAKKGGRAASQCIALRRQIIWSLSSEESGLECAPSQPMSTMKNVTSPIICSSVTSASAADRPPSCSCGPCPWLSPFSNPLAALLRSRSACALCEPGCTAGICTDPSQIKATEMCKTHLLLPPGGNLRHQV